MKNLTNSEKSGYGELGGPFLKGSTIVFKELTMTGSIRCRKCQKAMESDICQCGSVYCYIDMYWQKKHEKFKEDREKDKLMYQKAIRQLTIMRSEIDEGRFNPNNWRYEEIKKRSVTTKLREWLEDKEAERDDNRFAPSTYAQYKGYTHNYYIPLVGKYDVKEVGYTELKEMLKELKHLKIKTRKNIMNTFHAFMSWLWLTHGVAIPPFPVIDGDDAEEQGALEYEDQYDSLMKIPDSKRDCYEFGFETGLRVSELCAVKVKDFNFKTAIAVIQRTYSYRVLKETTKAKSKKPIPLSQRAYEIAVKHAQGKFPDDFLFINPNTGKGFTDQALRKCWYKYTGKKVTLYEAMRHSFCTQLIEDGAPVEKAQKLMRHSDIRSTMKYLHLNVSKLRNFVENRGRSRVTWIHQEESQAVK